MGRKPRSQQTPEDPAIAQERAKRQSLAISQNEQRRSARFGAGSTALTGRTGDEFQRQDISQLSASKKGEQVVQLERALQGTQEKIAPIFGTDAETFFGDSDISQRLTAIQSSLTAARKGITPSDKEELALAKNDASIIKFIKRNRKRVGTSRTGA